MNIALICDFFYPRLGGVENHVMSLASCLRRLGHKVIVVTHAYSCNGISKVKRHTKRTGVRYLPGTTCRGRASVSSPIKVYYCPFLPMTDQTTLPTFTATFPLIRWIFIREKIQVVHSHQATSTMANEAVFYASEMGLASVYTDHSLFGFDDVASLILNRVCYDS